MKERQQKCLAVLAAAGLIFVLGACTAPDDSAVSPGLDAEQTASQSGESEPVQSEPAPVTGSPMDEGPEQTGGEGDETAPPDDDPAGGESEPGGEKPTPSASDTPTPSGADVTFVAPGRVAESASVEEEWFSDAVFVGDSRTDGLKLYSGIKSASFISHQGLSVFTIGDKECIELNGSKVTALTALGQRQWSKVYLMLGINELGYSSEAYEEAYTKLVQRIKEIQPNATIYLQTVLPVNEPLAQSKGISSAITNARVILFNEVIARVAESEETALVDVAEAFWTSEGCMSEDNTSDGVHLTRQGYVAWFEYLKCHTGTTTPVDEPDPDEGSPVVFEDPDEGADQQADPEPEAGQAGPAGPESDEEQSALPEG